MTINDISSATAVLAALSVASERLVEIIKGIIPALNQQNSDPTKEGFRRTALQILALLAGLLTAYLTKDTSTISTIIPDTKLAWIPLGLLASGGSGFWNSIQTYVAKAKDVKKAALPPANQ